jgi:hypothetical protein
LHNKNSSWSKTLVHTRDVGMPGPQPGVLASKSRKAKRVYPAKTKRGIYCLRIKLAYS